MGGQGGGEPRIVETLRLGELQLGRLPGGGVALQGGLSAPGQEAHQGEAPAGGDRGAGRRGVRAAAGRGGGPPAPGRRAPDGSVPRPTTAAAARGAPVAAVASRRASRAAVEHLALRVQEAPDFAARVSAAGVDPAALVAAVGALGYCEKAALLDLALQAQAPAAAQDEARG